MPLHSSLGNKSKTPSQKNNNKNLKKCIFLGIRDIAVSKIDRVYAIMELYYSCMIGWEKLEKKQKYVSNVYGILGKCYGELRSRKGGSGVLGDINLGCQGCSHSAVGHLSKY